MAKINDLPLLSNPTEDMYCLVGKEDLQKVPWSAIMGQIGAPYIATTVAGMTDKTRVYVYQGSESGYTSGNWYYWNGSAWTSGGTYNSAAVNTDKTLTQSDKPADSAIVGKEIGSLKESKVQKPIDNGTDGQFLKNNGDGTTKWSNIDTDLKDNAITVTKLTANTAKGLYSVKEPNYVNKNKVCRKSDGTITGYANINCTDYLETDNIVGIICDPAVSFNNFYAITFLDDTKKVISGIDGTEDLGGGYKKTTKLLSIPDDSKYCVINNFTAHPSSITILEKYTNNSLANKALELTNCLSKTIPINTLTPLKDAKKCIAKIKTSKPSTVHIYKRNIIPEYEDGTYTASGVTVTVKNNRITLNGTVTGNGGVGLKVKKPILYIPERIMQLCLMQTEKQ